MSTFIYTPCHISNSFNPPGAGGPSVAKSLAAMVLTAIQVGLSLPYANVEKWKEIYIYLFPRNNSASKELNYLIWEANTNRS